MFLGEGLFEDWLEILFFWNGLDLFQIIDVLSDLFNVSLLFFPKSIDVLCSNYNGHNNGFGWTNKNKFKFSCLGIGKGSHSGEWEFVEVEAVFHVDVFISSLIDGIGVDIFLVEIDFRLDWLIFEGEVDEWRLFGLDVIIEDSNILFALDIDANLITVDIMKVLAFSAGDLVVLTNFDGILGQHRHWFLIAFNFGFLYCLFFILLVLNWVLELLIYLAHAVFVAALVIDQNISIRALFANISIDILITS